MLLYAQLKADPRVGEARVGLYPIVTLENQRLGMIGSLVYSARAVLRSDDRL